MSIYYADINNSYAGYVGDGSSGNPWSYSMLFAGPQLIADDTLYIRGRRVADIAHPDLNFPITSSYTSTGPTIKAWDKIVYGPYIFEAPSGTVSLFWGGYNQHYTTQDAVIIANTILFAPGFSLPHISMKNCILYGNFSYIKDSGSIADTFDACTFASGVFSISDYSYQETGSINAQFNYCLLLNFPFTEPVSADYKGEGNITFRGCASTLSQVNQFSGLAVITHTNQESLYSASGSLLTQFPNYTGLRNGNYVNSGVLRYEDYNLPIPYITGFNMRADWDAGSGTSAGFDLVSRRGYGAFYFSPNYYVNLSTNGIDGMKATSGQPFTVDEFKYWTWGSGAYNLYGSGDVLNIRGTTTQVDNYNLFNYSYYSPLRTVVAQGWNLETYGPWGIYTPSGITIGGTVTMGGPITIRDAILKGDSYVQFNCNPTIVNSYIATSGNAGNTQVSFNTNFYGCTLNLKTPLTGHNYILSPPWGGEVHYRDCLFTGDVTFKHSAPTGPLTIYLDHCTSTAPSASGMIYPDAVSSGYLTVIPSGCEWSWIDGKSWSSWPSPTGFAQADWNYKTLGSGITNSGTRVWSS